MIQAAPIGIIRSMPGVLPCAFISFVAAWVFPSSETGERLAFPTTLAEKGRLIALIEFRNVSKVYNNGTEALHNINLTVDKGEFVFIVGSSGAGKSTFLKLVMCEERPNSGQIIVDGVDVTRLPKRKIPYIRRKMGIVFQDFRLIDHMTVYDNVAFAMRVVGASARSIRKRVPYIPRLKSRVLWHIINKKDGLIIRLFFSNYKNYVNLNLH